MTTFCVRNSGSDFYRYMNWFASAWEESGGTIKEQMSIPHKIRAVLGRLAGRNLGCAMSRVIVCASFRIESMAWPWCCFNEIIPVLWDLWPSNYVAFRTFCKRNRVRHVFCTAQQSVDWINGNCKNVAAHWMPEGVNVASYPRGAELCARSVDVLSYGRRVESLHELLLESGKSGELRYQVGGGGKFVELTCALRQSKISVCYPKCVTSPIESGGVETLTQRYWEAMCSGTLLMGHAPQELIEVCGYNPVIELGDNPIAQIKGVLRDIHQYQALAEKNRKCAEAKGDWISRVVEIRRIIGDLG